MSSTVAGIDPATGYPVDYVYDDSGQLNAVNLKLVQTGSPYSQIFYQSSYFNSSVNVQIYTYTASTIAREIYNSQTGKLTSYSYYDGGLYKIYEYDYDPYSGALTTYIQFTGKGTPTYTTNYSSDGSYNLQGPTFVNYYNSAKILVEQDGYDASGRKALALFRDPASGMIFQQDGYSATGNRTFVNYYDHTTGALTEQVGYDTSGRFSQIIAYDASGGRVVSNYTVGLLQTVTGYDPTGTKTFTNILSAGVLTEQDGYDSGGHLALVISRNAITQFVSQMAGYTADGQRTFLNSYDSAGRLLEQDGFDAAGHNILSITQDTSRAGKTVTSHDAAGHITSQVGYDSNGAIVWRNLFNGTGSLTEQDGYDSSGSRTLGITHAQDGSYASFHFATDGSLLSSQNFDSTGRLTALTSSLPGTYYETGYGDHASLAATAGTDVMSGGGADQHFVFNGVAGADTIVNFHAGSVAGHDIIQLGQTPLTDYQTLLAHTHDVTGGALIDIDGINSILLQGVQAASLTSADFIFM